MFGFLKSNKKPKKKLIVFGTDFGSYQINQLIEIADEFEVVGFISDDPWQRKSSFGKVGVFYSSEIQALMERESAVALLVPSDQKKELDSLIEEKQFLELSSKLVYFDIMSLPAGANTKRANEFLHSLLQGSDS